MPSFNLCRICLTENINISLMQPLFDESNAQCAEIVQKIEDCGGIRLKHSDQFPKVICSQCMDSLNIAHKFRTMCQASENALLDVLIKSELKAEPQDINNMSNLPSESQHEIFFDLQTEFIDAREVDLSEMVDNKLCSLEKGENEDNSLDNYIVSASESDCDEEFIPEKKVLKKTKKTKKASLKPSRRRGRPRLQSVTTFLERKTSKSGRGRKKLEEAQSNIMCEICGNIYTKRSLLNMHMRRHQAEKPFECEICGKTFACPSEISRHMRVHTGEKPYICRFCGRTFADRSTNIKHERIHTNTRPFTCNTCGKSFTYSNVLKNHMLTHTGEKPFLCVSCNKTFSRKHQLDQHISTITHKQTVKSLSSSSTVIKEGIDILLQT